MKKACTFCEIVKGCIPAQIIYRDKHVIAFLPKEMNVRGHALVAPVRHVDTVFTMTGEDATQLMRGMKAVAGLLRKKLCADGINILHASGKAAQQSVMHLHFHIFPRFQDDGVDAWPALQEWHGDRAELVEQLRGKKTRKTPNRLPVN